jgi:hypothetical protein
MTSIPPDEPPPEDRGASVPSLQELFGDQQDLAWGRREDREPDPRGRDTVFFYRPGELLVQAEARPAVLRALDELGVRTCPVERPAVGRWRGILAAIWRLVARLLRRLGIQIYRPGRRHQDRVVRILVASREPVPAVLRQLRRRGLRPDQVGLNHVFFPVGVDISGATPWFSGGAESLPVEAGEGTATPPALTGGNGAQVGVFDSGLLKGYEQLAQLAPWLANVGPFIQAEDVEDEDPLDIYDNHGLFVSGIIGYTAPAASVFVRNILSETGAVDDDDLAKEITPFLTNGGLRLVNLSLGGTTVCDEPPLALANLVADHPGVVFVASAGNSSSATEIFYPAALPRVVGVGALDKDGNPACFSNTSAESAKVWANGVNVVSAFRHGTLQQPPLPLLSYSTERATWSGTSFSTPRVTAALCEYLALTSPPLGGPVQWLGIKYGTNGPGNRPVIP